MYKYCLFLLLLGFSRFTYAQTEEKVVFEYASFTVIYNDLGDEKFKGGEELIQSMTRKLKGENKEVEKEFYYLKNAEQTLNLLGKNGFELVTCTSIKTQEGIQVHYYLKKRIVIH